MEEKKLPEDELLREDKVTRKDEFIRTHPQYDGVDIEFVSDQDEA